MPNAHQVGSPENVVIEIYDTLGQKIATVENEVKSAGQHFVHFNGNKFASGIYYYKIQAGSFMRTKKMLLIE